MYIEKTTEQPKTGVGRPAYYPFEDLNPGERLIIPCDSDIKKKQQSISNALASFKRKNGFKWKTAVRSENNNVAVYRIS